MTTRLKNAIDALEVAAYEEIFQVLYKHKDIIVFNVESLESAAKHHLFGIELKEKYGLNINPKSVSNLEWVILSDYITVSWYGEKYRRRISWSDDGRQPEEELLLSISFPTGAHIFGQDYPEDLFRTFFDELKSYGSDYCDSHNHNLYFKVENAKEVFNNFPEIMKKYHELNKGEAARRNILRLKKQLEELESSNQVH